MGKIIVIDGLDGSGKATQSNILTENLNKLGYNTRLVSFPAYESKSSELVKMYLAGDIGKDAKNINPYAASVLYACDRFIQFQTNLDWFKNSGENDILICDRYISANILHQGAKIIDDTDRHRYYDWCYEFEDKIGVPKEFMTIMLLVKPEISQKLLKKTAKQKVKNDIHENNIDYLKDCYSRAMDAAEYCKWKVVNCSPENDILLVNDISKQILDIVLYNIQ